MLSLPLLCGVTGCLGTPGAETTSGSVATEGSHITIGADNYAWGGEAQARGTVWASSEIALREQDGTECSEEVMPSITVTTGLLAQGPRWALDPAARSLGLKVSQSVLTDGIQGVLGTELGLIVFHRPAYSHFSWEPTYCGAHAGTGQGLRGTGEPIGYFTEPFTIEAETRAIRTQQGEAIPFADCGIDEDGPEFAVSVIPTYQFWPSWEGTFDFTLFATCDGATCPAGDAIRAADESWGDAGVPWVGLTYSAASQDLAAFLGLSWGVGVVVTQIWDDSPAARAGLHVGDVVTRIDDCPARLATLASLVRAAGSGKTVALEIHREGEAPRTVMVDVVAKPATFRR